MKFPTSISLILLLSRNAPEITPALIKGYWTNSDYKVFAFQDSTCYHVFNYGRFGTYSLNEEEISISDTIWQDRKTSSFHVLKLTEDSLILLPTIGYYEDECNTPLK